MAALSCTLNVERTHGERLVAPDFRSSVSKESDDL